MAPASHIKATNSSVESTVTKLLISTKQLLQVLTQWSKGIVNEKAVSDSYVQLGNDLKIVSKFFKHLDVDVSDLVVVPKNLRKVLESALRESPSEETLNRFLPTIRDIIVTLLEKLKVKQAELKARKQETHESDFPGHRKTASVMSTVSTTTSLGSDNGTNGNSKSRSPSVVLDSNSNSNSIAGVNSQEDVINRRDQISNYKSSEQVSTGNNDMSSNSHVDVHKSALTPHAETITSAGATSLETQSSPGTLKVQKTRTVSETEALLQLKNGSNLQRRASKRFSAYQIAKLTNQSSSDAAAATPANMIITNSADQTDLERERTFSRLSSATSNIDDNESVPMEQSGSISKTISGSENGKVLFLKLGNRVKRCNVIFPSNINELRLLFVKEFAYSPGTDDFPSIYIRDSEYDVFYELEQSDLNNIKPGTVLELRVLNDNGNRFNMNEVVHAIKNELNMNQRFLLEEVKKLTLSNEKPSNVLDTVSESNNSISPLDSKSVKDINHELSILRQIRNDEYKAMKLTISKLLEKVELFKTLHLEEAGSSTRSYIEKSQSKLGVVSDNLLSKVDDIQDIIEVLRKDVAVRGVNPSKKKLDAVLSDLNEAEKELSSMQSFISTEKPGWKRIWESELDKVCEEQQFLTLQEDLAFDLVEDLKKASETFELVKLCCEEQEKYPKKVRTNPILPIPKPGTLNQTRDQLLVDVQSLVPDHESRVDALEKAQKIWQKERILKENDEFQEELGTFVGNASFKKTGGIEEIERIRQQKNEENLRAGLGII
ncbi:hypothetical protein TPHA_0K01490 [Tetrapisispora phaffii CBS 4417]|uniref:Actin interacting protein 3 C-terminal domain-containing protein n=1 Tax=Tetrapisispora phaffii (strain ATCC 24235 / CBS 4417 / NBRC 1672 / NRRL Y-8282 / UCD 70-5) TaxID=1071381 RepID=G8BZF4_TETPH|nr:hypothetical protein TPHA_0K01490 [Tetrapisispora phaffii CBS 4417]CCE65282.1 hypothetical protein TPHA_0K01490 [Tetrapisispora phaffii CBS 4417]